MGSSDIIRTRKLTGVNYRPIEVRFKYDQPEYVQVYEEVFQAPLKFKAKEDALVIAQSDLNLKNPGHRLYIYDLLTGHAKKLLVDIESGEHFTDKVQRIILERLPIEPADIQLVCNKLNLSRWTLNRKLRREGSVFKSLCLETKKNLAMNYLKNQKLSVSEIAYLLGYTEAGSFTRAFKEWTGQSPKAYRLGVDGAGDTLLQDCQKE